MIADTCMHACMIELITDLLEFNVQINKALTIYIKHMKMQLSEEILSTTVILWLIKMTKQIIYPHCLGIYNGTFNQQLLQGTKNIIIFHLVQFMKAIFCFRSIWKWCRHFHKRIFSSLLHFFRTVVLQHIFIKIC